MQRYEHVSLAGLNQLAADGANYRILNTWLIPARNPQYVDDIRILIERLESTPLTADQRLVLLVEALRDLISTIEADPHPGESEEVRVSADLLTRLAAPHVFGLDGNLRFMDRTTEGHAYYADE